MNTKTIKLDINKRLYEKITAKQGDTKSRFLLFHLLDGASPFSLVNRTVRVYGLKPDKKEIFNDLKIVDANKGHCELELTNQALAIIGDLDLELAIYEGESKLTSIPFTVDVLKSINSTNAIESSNEYKALDRSLTKVEEWNNEFADKSGKLEQLYTERLNGIDSHLAETVQQSLKNKRGFGKKQCIAVFISDDGNDNDYNILKPIFAEKGNIPWSVCIGKNLIGKFTQEHIRDLVDNYGVEVGSHTMTHSKLPNLTTDEIDFELKESKKWIEEYYKVPCKWIAYPNGESDDRVRRIAKLYYEFGFATGDVANSYPLESYSMRRIALGAYYGGEKKPLSYFTQKVDQAFLNNELIVFMLHGSEPEFDDSQRQILKDVIDYIKSKGILITTPTKAYELLGNTFTSGDDHRYQGTNSVDISAFGEMYINRLNANTINCYKISSIGLDINSPISSYPIGTKTYAEFLSISGSGFPENNGGVLVTFRDTNNDGLSYQDWKPVTSNRTYRRSINTDGNWKTFELINGFNIQKVRTTIPAFNTIGANSFAVKELRFSTNDINFRQIDTVQFQTFGYYEEGVIPKINIKGANWIKIELYNTTSNPITPTSRDLIITVIPTVGNSLTVINPI